MVFLAAKANSRKALLVSPLERYWVFQATAASTLCQWPGQRGPSQRSQKLGVVDKTLSTGIGSAEQRVIRILEHLSPSALPVQCSSPSRSDPNPNREAHMQTTSADVQQHHIVQVPYPSGFDADGPTLASDASSWRIIEAEAPGFTCEMDNVAILFNRTELGLVSRYNGIAKDLGLPPVDHISDATNRARNKFISTAEQYALELALGQFFTEIAGDKAQQCRKQLSICHSWTRTRHRALDPVILTHPTLLAEELQQVWAEIQQDSAYEDIREAAMVLTEQFAQARHISL